jgi:hypothetical protein
LYRGGWKRDSLKPGDEIAVEGYLAKDGTATLLTRVVTTADGRRMFAGNNDAVRSARLPPIKRSSNSSSMNTHLLLAVLIAAWPAPAQSAYKVHAPGTTSWTCKESGKRRTRRLTTSKVDTASTGIPAGAGVIVDPPDGKTPYQPAALAKRNQNSQDRATADPVAKCYIPGVPRLTYLPFPLQIFQYMIIASEYVHNYRTIYLYGSRHLAGVDFYNGDSRGHWRATVWSLTSKDSTIKPGSIAPETTTAMRLHVVERYTRTGPDTLTYEATIEDPKLFTRPGRSVCRFHFAKKRISACWIGVLRVSRRRCQGESVR